MEYIILGVFSLLAAFIAFLVLTIIPEERDKMSVHWRGKRQKNLLFWMWGLIPATAIGALLVLGMESLFILMLFLITSRVVIASFVAQEAHELGRSRSR